MSSFVAWEYAMVSALRFDASTTVRTDAFSSRCRTRVTRQRTVEPTLGRLLEVFVFVERRGTEMVGLLDLDCAGVVAEMPIMEAMMLDS